MPEVPALCRAPGGVLALLAALSALALARPSHAGLPKGGLEGVGLDSAAPPAFVDGLPDEVEEGHVTLRWKSRPLAGDETYQLQHGSNAAFDDARTVLDGKDDTSFISGLPDGEHYFRVRLHSGRGKAGPWSVDYSLTVEHHSLAVSLGLFGVGAIVFVLTVAFVMTRGFQAAGEARG